jgi:hypothetical protein
VIDRPEPAAAQPLGELVGIDEVALVALPRLAPLITDDDALDARRE